MKKLLSLLIVLTMIIGIIPVVSAAVDNNVVENLTLNKLVKNSGIGSENFLSEGKDGFDSYYAFTATSGTAKFNVNFDSCPAMDAGSNVYVSFYYKINSKAADGTTAATIPATFYPYNGISASSGTGLGFGYNKAGATDEWIFASFVSPVKTAITAESTPYQRFVMTSASGAYIEIADVRAVYMGTVTQGDGEDAVNTQITNALSSTAITSLSVGGENVADLTTGSYTASSVVSADDISVSTTYGTADKVIVEANEDSITVMVYAPAVDWTTSSAQPSATYTINQPKASEFTFDAEYVVCENNVELTTSIKEIASENAFVDVLTEDETTGTPFDTIYTFTTKAGTATTEGTVSDKNNVLYLGNTDSVPAEGDWIYIKFYVRSLGTYTDEKGNPVTGNTLRIYPRFNEVSFKTQYDSYFNTKNDTWVEYTCLLQATSSMASKENCQLRFACPITTSSTDEGGSTVTTATFTDSKVQIAGVQVLNFGQPVITSGIPSDTEISNKINEILGTYGLTGVYRSDSEDNIYDADSNPLTIITGPRYSVGVDSTPIIGSTIFGANTAKVTKDGDTYKVTSYAPNYDWINGTGGKEEYIVNVIPEYDFTDLKLYQGDTLVTNYNSFNNGAYTLKLNGLRNGADLSGVVIGASYDASGNMLKIAISPSFTLTNGNVQELSVTVPASENIASFKFFVWDGLVTGVPYIKTINVGTNGITQ